MNAQEAIERVEWTIEQHKQMQMFFADKRDAKQVGRYESLEKDVKALSVVLESAKLLHQDILEPSRQTEWRGKADERLSILYDIPEEGIEILADDLERIGIKEDNE